MFRRNRTTAKRIELDASTRDSLRSFAADLMALHALNNELIRIGEGIAASLNGHITDAVLSENNVDVFTVAERIATSGTTVYDQDASPSRKRRKQVQRMSRAYARSRVCGVINENGWIEPRYQALRWALDDGRGADPAYVAYYQHIVTRECKTLLFERKVEKGKAKHPGSLWRYYKPRGSAPIS